MSNAYEHNTDKYMLKFGFLWHVGKGIPTDAHTNDGLQLHRHDLAKAKSARNGSVVPKITDST